MITSQVDLGAVRTVGSFKNWTEPKTKLTKLNNVDTQTKIELQSLTKPSKPI